jgi:SAM-dependent methyltransferase
MAATDYQARIAAQIEQFREPGALSKLPSIYRYWTQRHIVPRIKHVFGIGSIFDAYFDAIKAAAERKAPAGAIATLFSMGAGDCALEINIAARLKAAGLTNSRVVCIELSPLRLARAKAAASGRGVADFMDFAEGDLNSWRANETVDVFMAHHTLHHVEALESLYDEMAAAMEENSVFLTADMIGRNGHQRWPEVLGWIQHLWQIMPDRYKFQFQFKKWHEAYLDWDCSISGFEGIRAQEVLPLLLRNFDYDRFLGFGGIIDPFIERGYGHNLDPENGKDTEFIDFVENLNQTLLETGRIKPTMMIGAFRKGVGKQSCFGPLTPAFCVRKPDSQPGL